LTEFVATEEQTKRWLTGSVHQNNGKMLFMVETPDAELIGHVGLGFIDWEQGYGEADAIVSGGNSPRGLMKASLLTLMRWSRDVLGLQTLSVRVRSDNSAVEFYRKVGFREFKRVPIVAHFVSHGIDWYEDPLATDALTSLVYMNLEIRD
jgi:RimJ/RimL family protein N-acetyltransferase